MNLAKEFLNKESVKNFLEDELLKIIEKIIPARIISYDKNTNRCSCRITICDEDNNNEVITPPELIDIPVFNYGNSNFGLKFKIEEGDLGYLLACDKDITKFKKDYIPSSPEKFIRHRYFNGFFLPDKMVKPINTDDDIYIGDTNISTFLTINKDDLKLNSKEININATDSVKIKINGVDAIKIENSKITFLNNTLEIDGNTNYYTGAIVTQSGSFQVKNGLIVNV